MNKDKVTVSQPENETIVTEIHNLIVLDSSGSMSGIKQATINNFNEQIQDIKSKSAEFPDVDSRVTLVVFSNASNINTTLLNESSENAQELNDSTYNPNGGTALIDAVLAGIGGIEGEAGEKIDSGEARVLVTIITDGHENASKNSRQTLADAIKEREEQGAWTFTFIGANIDSVTVAQTYNISASNAVQFNATVDGMAKMSKGLSRGRSAYYSSTVSSDSTALESFRGFSDATEEEGDDK